MTRGVIGMTRDPRDRSREDASGWVIRVTLSMTRGVVIMTRGDRRCQGVRARVVPERPERARTRSYTPFTGLVCKPLPHSGLFCGVEEGNQMLASGAVRYRASRTVDAPDQRPSASTARAVTTWRPAGTGATSYSHVSGACLHASTSSPSTKRCSLTGASPPVRVTRTTPAGPAAPSMPIAVIETWTPGRAALRASAASARAVSASIARRQSQGARHSLRGQARDCECVVHPAAAAGDPERTWPASPPSSSCRRRPSRSTRCEARHRFC
jgi:hypothetical protein